METRKHKLAPIFTGLITLQSFLAKDMGNHIPRFYSEWEVSHESGDVGGGELFVFNALVPLRSSRLPYQGHKRANAGEDFTARAKELSEKPGADKSCGDLGFFPKDRMVSEFVEASFALTKK